LREFGLELEPEVEVRVYDSTLEGSIVAFVEQSSRFLKPVLIGDTITPELEVTELVPKTDVGLLRLTTRVKNQRGEVVLEGMHAYLIKKRPRT